MTIPDKQERLRRAENCRTTIANELRRRGKGRARQTPQSVKLPREAAEAAGEGPLYEAPKTSVP
jgi:hypothetical protein